MMKKNRVVHLLNPYLFLHGSWIYTQLKGVKEFESHVFTYRTENEKLFPFPRVVSAYSFPFHQKMMSILLNRIYDNFGYFFYKYEKQIDPVLYHAHMGMDAARWLNFVKKTGKPLITSFYGQDVSKLGRLPYWQKRYHELFDYGTHFLAEGNNLKKQLVSLGCPPEKVIIQKLGVDVGNYPVKDYKIVNESEIVILQASSFVEKKGLIYTIQGFDIAANENKRIKLKILGGGKTEEEFEINALIAKCENKDRIELLGSKSHRQFLDELSKSDIFIHPSIAAIDGDNEGGSPVGITEASACGIPVISTFHADIPEAVINQKTGLLVQEKDSVALASEICKLAASPDMRKNFGLAGREHIKLNFNLVLQIKKLESIYQKVMLV